MRSSIDKNARAVAILPARGGSKRIPRKNVRLFRGRSMLEWPVAAALASGVFARVMVSTDDEEVAAIARACGAEVPFMRSAKTADDHASTSDVLLEVLDAYAAQGEEFDLGCCIYATAPFVEGHDLASGRAMLERGEFDVIMPVAQFDHPIWRSLARDSEGKIALNYPEHLNARSQDLPPAYYDAGQWYWFRVAAFKRDRVLMGPNTGSVVLSAERVQDIDTDEDWRMAEWKHERLFG